MVLVINEKPYKVIVHNYNNVLFEEITVHTETVQNRSINMKYTFGTQLSCKETFPYLCIFLQVHYLASNAMLILTV